MNTAIVILVGVIVILASSCKSDSTSSPGERTLSDVAALSSTDPLAYWYNQYDGTNLIAVFNVGTTHFDIMNWTTRVESVTFDVTGNVLNPTNELQPGILSSPRVNGAFLEGVSAGVYRWLDGQQNPLLVNFGVGSFNRFEADSGEMFPAIRDSVSFGQSVSIVGLPFNSILSKSTSLVVPWMGCGSDFVHISLTRHETERDSLPDGFVITYANFFPNTGTSTIPASEMARLSAGKYNLDVTQIQPKFITLSNGKRIALIGRSTHEITVNIQ